MWVSEDEQNGINLFFIWYFQYVVSHGEQMGGHSTEPAGGIHKGIKRGDHVRNTIPFQQRLFAVRYSVLPVITLLHLQ